MRRHLLPAISFLTTAALALAAPASAQTFGANPQGLPAPSVVRMPMTFGGSRPVADPLDRPIAAGEFTTRVRSVRDRVAAMQRVHAERVAQERALIAQRGAGKPIELRKRRY